ncbi:hypothetical protein SME02_004943 [Klebsiella aerogenes]|nr:hypothetical protein [Klebsiella aerogenes]ELY3087842.1 hypothetical protein [Klebsiella aerogenes]
MEKLKLSLIALALTSSMAAHAAVTGPGASQHYQLDVVEPTQITHTMTPMDSLEAGHLADSTPLVKGTVNSSKPVNAVALQWVGGSAGSSELEHVFADANNASNHLSVRFVATTAGAAMQDGSDGQRYFVIPAISGSASEFNYVVTSAGDQELKAGSYDIAVNAYQWIS